MKEIFKKSILILAIFAIWQVVCELEIFTPYILPSPAATLKTMYGMSLSGELATHTIISIIELLYCENGCHNGDGL